MPGLDISRLREARHLAGYSQDSAARVIGVTVATVKNWEAERRRPSAYDLGRIADAYGCTADWLLGRTDVGPVKRATPPAEVEDPMAPAAAPEPRLSDGRTRKAG